VIDHVTVASQDVMPAGSGGSDAHAARSLAQTIDEGVCSPLHKNTRFLLSLALDKLLGDGPELLGMVCVQSIRHITGEG
jgi:hypothetical protein